MTDFVSIGISEMAKLYVI